MVDIIKPQDASVQPKKKERKIVTFYLYDQNGQIDKRAKKIYSPFNEKTKGRLPTEDAYVDPVIFEFEGGVYETDDEQSIEALDAWATGGQKRLSNGRKFGPDQVHRVKRDSPKPKANTVSTVEKIVEIAVLPRVIIDTMTVAQIQALASSWGIEIPKDIGSGENVKEQIIRLLDESGHIK